MKRAAAEKLKTGKSYSVPSLPDGEQKELGLQLYMRICAKCGKNEAHSTSLWCDPCMWNLIRDDQK